MSRLGKSPIKIPNGVEVSVKGNKVFVKGPKGHLEQDLMEGISIKQEDGTILVIFDESSKLKKSFYGLAWALVNNMIQGVSKGFEKRLSLIGVGYRAAVQGSKLDLQVGYSHPTSLDIPKDLTITVEKGTSVKIVGANKQKVGQFAAVVRSTRPPEPYKGKGIRYEDEYVRKKAGKAAKAGAK